MKSQSRRSLLKTFAGLAGAAMYRGLFNDVWAQSAPPLRLILLSSPHGCAPQFWRPRMPNGQAAAETGWTLDFDPDSSMGPLEPHKSSLLLLEGLDLTCLQRPGASYATGHAGGIIAPFTGSDARSISDRRAKSPSLDTWLGTLLKQKVLLYKMFGYMGATSGYAFDATGERVNFLYDPRDLYRDWFATAVLPTTDTALAQRRKAAELKVLSMLKGDASKLKVRLAASERPKLEAHLEGLNLIETRLQAPLPGNCSKPTAPVGAVTDPISEFHTVRDLVVSALACNLTQVVNVMIEMGSHLPGVDLGGASRAVHNDVVHSYRADDELSARYVSRVNRWSAQRVAELIVALKSVPENGKTLYDSTIILWANELGDPAQHLSYDLPFVVAGGGGTHRKGRYLKFASQPHNGLLVSLANQFGGNRTFFGEPDLTGELPGFL
jgi:hypothetical protein